MRRLNRRKVSILFVILVVSAGLNLGQATHSSALAQEEDDFNYRLGYLMNMEEVIIRRVLRMEGQVLTEEAQIKYDWVRKVMLKSAESNMKADRARTPEERQVWLNDARLKADTGERLIKYFLGPEVKYNQAWSNEAWSTKGSPPEDVEERIKNLKDLGQNFLAVVKEYIDEVRRVPQVDQRTVKDLYMKQDKLSAAIRQVVESVEKARTATTRAEAEFWLNDAGIKKQTVETMTKAIVGKEIQLKLKLKPMTGFSSGILYQMGLHDEYLQEVIIQNDPQIILNKAIEDFGEGRAGAGGISLHKAAEVLTPLDMSMVRGVTFEKERLILLYGEQQIAFPPLDPEHLALAIRSIYGNEGVIKGKLVADEPKAVVIQTGREQFGEVVWKKEFLPTPWVEVPVGQPVELALGPAIGVLSLPKPSVARVTYYGPIKNTRMGKVLLEADGLLTTFLFGVDWKTGLPLPPPNVEGYMTDLERSARRALVPSTEEKDKPTTEADDEKQWWHESGWFCWVPDEFTLSLSSDGTALEFVDTRMKLSVWSVNEENVSADYREMATHSTEHYQELAQAFPVLKDLEEVAKAVSVVRWLKQNNVPIGLSWANGCKIQEVSTPENISKFVVTWASNESGKPLIERQTNQ